MKPNEERETIYNATKLAKWLIEKQGLPHKKAYIVATKKHKLEHYSIVATAYQKIKRKQTRLF